jgi:hypothetical protein
MKPWFVKEADIIKFPEPEKKVVELPNVQSYPDFITGVKDLHNRKDKGEISQDSHDKLYSDLINRFMKKESFETPWFLRENTRLDEGLLDDTKFLFRYITHNWKKFAGTLLKVAKDLIFKSKKDFPDQEKLQNENVATGITSIQSGQDFLNTVSKKLNMGLEQLMKELSKNPSIKQTVLNNIQQNDTPIIQKHIDSLPAMSGEYKTKLKNIYASAECIKVAIDPNKVNQMLSWLTSGPLKGQFDKSINNWINIKQELGNNEQAKLLQYNPNALIELAKLQDPRGGRGEQLIKHLYGGQNIAGGQEGGDIKIDGKNYEMKTNGRKMKSGIDKSTGQEIKVPVKEPSYGTLHGASDTSIFKQGAEYLKNILMKEKGMKNVDKNFFTQTKGLKNSWNSFGTQNWIDFFNEKIQQSAEDKRFDNRAEEIATVFLEKMHGNLPSGITKKIKSATTNEYNAALYKKALAVMAGAGYYAREKFDGVIYLNIHAGTSDQILLKTFAGKDLAKSINNGSIKTGVEDLNSLYASKATGQPGTLALTDR